MHGTDSLIYKFKEKLLFHIDLYFVFSISVQSVLFTMCAGLQNVKTSVSNKLLGLFLKAKGFSGGGEAVE